jgi:hypothetical protein
VAARQWGGEDVRVLRASPSPCSAAGYVFAVLIALVSGVLLPAATAVAVPEPAAAATSAPPTDPAADPPIVTLADDRNLDECVSAMPRPGCRTSTDTDAMQIAVFSVLIGALVLIGWRIGRATRQRDRAAASVGPP